LRLTAPEAFSLLTSARAAMELPGADPAGALGRGLAKLAAVLAEAGIETGSNAEGDDTAGVVVDLARPALTDDLVEAAATGTELAIGYYSPARAEMTQRSIVPRHVFADAGNWYVLADDDRSLERRTFRIDRIESIEPTGRTVDVEAAMPPKRFFEDADVARATIRLAPTSAWVLDQYPIDDVVEVADGWLEARLPVSGERWLSKLLIRLGPDATLVEPSTANPAADTARSMLERYRTGQRT
jgi:proteasome accessory factor C